MITPLRTAGVARSLQKVLVPIIYLVPIVHNLPEWSGVFIKKKGKGSYVNFTKVRFRTFSVLKCVWVFYPIPEKEKTQLRENRSYLKARTTVRIIKIQRRDGNAGERRFKSEFAFFFSVFIAIIPTLLLCQM